MTGDLGDLIWRFTYHPPTSERVINHEEIRARCLNLAEFLYRTLPEGREKSVAITRLEEVMFWANAAIAREREPNAQAQARPRAA